jgi:uncharacterized protein
MNLEPATASLESVRRLTVTKQHLAGRLPARASRSAILAAVRDLAYVQWDPVTIVAPSHVIALWSRVGDFRLRDLERLLWDEKKLFLHWTPIASIVLTEDYPLYYSLMRRYPDSLSRSWGAQRTRARRFLAQHTGLRGKILKELQTGPRLLSQFEDHCRTKRSDGEWNPGSDVSLMLYHLLMRGEVMVVGHEGNQNLWGLSDTFLPGWVKRTELSEEDFEREAAQRALRALGTATPTEIHYHFPRGCYQNLKGTLARLEEQSLVHRLTVEGANDREERYIHDRDLPLLESMSAAAWQPRLSLLPPFDNLLYSQARTNRLFGFDYVREQFLPKEKRRYGTYVLPLLWGEKLIGRVDTRLDNLAGELAVNAVFAEPAAPGGAEVGSEIATTLARFATFLGASRVAYSSRVPSRWKNSLR